MYEIFVIEKDEDVTFKKMLSKVFVGAPILIFVGIIWVMSARGGFKDSQESSSTVANEAARMFSTILVLIAFFLVIYGVLLIVRSVIAHLKWKKLNMFSPTFEPYTGKYYSIYLEPTTVINNKQILVVREYVKSADNLVQIKKKYSDGKSHELLTLLHDNVIETIMSRFNDVGLKVKVVEKDEP